MKAIVLVTVLALAALGQCVNLRNHEMNHQLPFLDSLNPLQMMSVLSGDYASLLPSFLQPLARKILGQEQKSGVAGFLDKAKGILGGGNSPTGGMFGGLQNLFGSAASSGNQGSASALSGLTNALGGQFSSSNPLSGLSSLGGLFKHE